MSATDVIIPTQHVDEATAALIDAGATIVGVIPRRANDGSTIVTTGITEAQARRALDLRLLAHRAVTITP